MAAAAIALLGLSASEVFALSLGRITVQSALGEPLRAEIEVPNISAEEAASLKANVASPAAFVAAGLEYNPAMAGLQATLARRADGRSYIRLSSDRPINDPFVDMILEANWSSGRIVRDYTMLFDPPSLKQSAPVPTLAQSSVPAPAPAPVPAPAPAKAAPAPAAPVAEAARPTAGKPAAAAPTPPANKIVSKPESNNAQQVVVKTGDSASKIAMRSKSSDVSLDQMLVALLRTNPDAFSKGNLNRLRAGAVLDLPSSDQAKSVSTTEATQTVVAQSKDFNEFRRNLAGSAPKTAVETADRKSTGKVEAKVDDKKPASTAADKLTLSKGALQSKADEAKLAKERADKDATARAAELAKNIADLNKLSAASAQKTAPAPAAASSATKPASPATPAVEVSKATVPIAAPAASAATAKATASPVTAASTPAQPKPAPAVVPVEEPGLIDQLLEDPALPLAGGGLIALLGGFALYRRQQAKKRTAHVDSSFLESRLQPDSFFGASGGQRVDTAQNGAAASSMNYTNSQLNAADDVDPVAEADVYLAYGRDMQAEEILKEALRHNPGRLAIHSKLLDIYVKRRDAGSFLSSAQNAFQLVGIESPEWAHICEQGLTIDPENPLYQPGGASASGFASVEQSSVAGTLGDSTVPISSLAEMPHAGTDLDLDLDFSAEDEANSGLQELSAQAPSDSSNEQTVKINAQEEFESNGLDFDISAPAELDTAHAAIPAAEMPQDLPDLSLSMEGLSLDVPTEYASAPAPVLTLPDFESTGPHAPEPIELEVEEPAKSSDGMLEFDLGSLSLDLGPGLQTPADDGSAAGDNSLATKLALAEEFVSIGDHDGARALIEEVVLEATGELREKAQRALANLS